MPLELKQPRWIITTLLVLAAGVIMIRLGFWQLDRLQQRRDFNSQVLSQVNLPALDLNNELPFSQLLEMEYRSVSVTGTYNFEQQVLLRNQVWEDQPGYHLLTPLMIKDSQYSILINRGWIPLGSETDLSQFNTSAQVTLQGMLRIPLQKATIGGILDPTLQPGETHLLAWNYLDMERIQKQISSPLLPVYIQENPGKTTPPIPSLPVLEITEGPHMAYAIQWFGFVALIWGAYPFYIKKQRLLNHSRKE